MKTPENKPRPDGRRALLLYLDPKVIFALKQKALEMDRPAYMLVEELLSERLTEAKKAKA